jgi:hypothetical protein
MIANAAATKPRNPRRIMSLSLNFSVIIARQIAPFLIPAIDPK